MNLSGYEEIPLDELDIFCKPIFEMTQQMPDFAGRVMRDHLTHLQSQATKSINCKTRMILSYADTFSKHLVELLGLL